MYFRASRLLGSFGWPVTSCASSVKNRSSGPLIRQWSREILDRKLIKLVLMNTWWTWGPEALRSLVYWDLKWKQMEWSLATIKPVPSYEGQVMRKWELKSGKLCTKEVDFHSININICHFNSFFFFFPEKIFFCQKSNEQQHKK